MPRWFHSSCFNAQLDSHINMAVADFRHASLTSVPHEIFKSKEGKALEEVYLDANQLRDLPRGLFNLQNLQILGLSDNELTILPSAVSNLVNLLVLDFSKNGITDIPEGIKNCKTLQEIDASVNPIGKIPDSFSQLINLTQLYLNDAFLDFLPGNFGRLTNLKILELRENHLRVLPKSMSHLNQLERLDIGNNEFSELPVVVGCLLNLRELWMDSNSVRELRPEIGLLRQLMFLDVSKNRLGSLPPEIDSLQALTDLYLSNNYLLELPDELGTLGNLQTLKLDENHIGDLPSSIGKLVNLEELILNCNELVTLPPSIGFLRKLRVLNVDENFLESIPSELGSCISMTIMSLRDNRLVHIPDDIGRMPKLQVIHLASNRLQYLPYSFHKLTSLKALWLSENQSKPMIPLQSDFDTAKNTHILTCYMFPQVSNVAEDNTSMNSVEIHSEADDGATNLAEVNFNEPPPQRSSIVFDINEDDYLARLERFSSPYPKDVKDRAMQYLVSRRQQLQQQSVQQDAVNQTATPAKHHGLQHREQWHHSHQQHPQQQSLPPQQQNSTSARYEDPEPLPPTPPPPVQLPEPESLPDLPPPPPFIQEEEEPRPRDQPSPQSPSSPLQQLLLRGRLGNQQPEEEQRPAFVLPSQLRSRGASSQGRGGVAPPQGRAEEVEEPSSRGRAPEVPWYEEQYHDSSDSGSVHSEQRDVITSRGGRPLNMVENRQVAVVAPSRPITNGNVSISSQGRMQSRSVPDGVPRVNGRVPFDTISQNSLSSTSSYEPRPAIPPPVYQTIPRPPPSQQSSYPSSHASHYSFREEAPSLESTMRHPPNGHHASPHASPVTGEWMRIDDAAHGPNYEETHSFRSEEPSLLYGDNQPILRPPSYHEAMGQWQQPTQVTENHLYVDQLRPSALGLVDNASGDPRFSPPPGYATIDPRDWPRQGSAISNGTSGHVMNGRQPVALSRPEVGKQQNGGLYPSSPPDIERFEHQVRQLQLERRDGREDRDSLSGVPLDDAPPPLPPPPRPEEDQFEVTIYKNPNLGFSVAGGAGSTGNPFDPSDNMSIYVTKVQPEGPAAFALKPGDKILEVNGLNLRNVPHDRAVLFLKNNQVVELLISRAKES